MKLWLLRPVHGDKEIGLWSPRYDKTFGFVIRAETEAEARAMAQKSGGDEVHEGPKYSESPAWTDPTHSTCEELTASGNAEIVISDHWSA